MNEAIQLLKETAAKHPILGLTLQEVKVFIPKTMSACMKFPNAQVRYRRDHQRFLDLFATVGYVRQGDKPVHHDGDACGLYVECDVEDYGIAYRLFCEQMKADPTFTAVGDLEAITRPEALRKAIEAQRSKEGD